MGKSGLVPSLLGVCCQWGVGAATCWWSQSLIVRTVRPLGTWCGVVRFGLVWLVVVS